MTSGGRQVCADRSGTETMSKGELTAIALFQHIADEDKLEKLLESQQIIKTPVVRNGKQSTLGYQPDVWKRWE